jgi:zinc transport system substrate-binding protein
MAINPRIPFFTIADSITLLESNHQHADEEMGGGGNEHDENFDPHIWLSPKNGLLIAEEITNFLSLLNPGHTTLYNRNFELLADSIKRLEAEADSLFSKADNKHFIIYHPNLAYLSNEYSLVEVAIEQEGKEPSSSSLANLIDIAAVEGINTVFIQKEFDKRYARSIAKELDAEVVVIDPLAEYWLGSMREIIESLYKSMER